MVSGQQTKETRSATYINTTGLVLRETAYRESSKILTVLTGGEGKLTVTAHGAVRRNSKLAAATQLLAFSEMTLYSRRDRWTLTEARSIEQFIGLRDDVTLLALGSYFAELTEAVADEDSQSPELLPLCLNALFALSEKLKEPGYVKPAFELRLMTASGFTPLIGHCSMCGQKAPDCVTLDLLGGTIRCAGCSSRDTSPRLQGNRGNAAIHEPGEAGKVQLSKGALEAARYIISCEAKKLFSFRLGGDALKELSVAAEGFLLAQLDRSFRTLEFFRQVNMGIYKQNFEDMG